MQTCQRRHRRSQVNADVCSYCNTNAMQIHKRSPSLRQLSLPFCNQPTHVYLPVWHLGWRGQCSSLHPYIRNHVSGTQISKQCNFHHTQGRFGAVQCSTDIESWSRDQCHEGSCNKWEYHAPKRGSNPIFLPLWNEWPNH